MPRECRRLCRGQAKTFHIKAFGVVRHVPLRDGETFLAWSAGSCLDLPQSFFRLERDEIGLNRHRALALCLSMIFSENRFTLFRIML
jgi:hypothetical protein